MNHPLLCYANDHGKKATLENETHHDRSLTPVPLSRRARSTVRRHAKLTLMPMKNIFHHIASVAVTAWVGSLWAIGYLAVPVLFYGQPDRQLAGLLAGKIFVSAGYVSLMCGAFLIAYFINLWGRAVLRQPLFWTVASMLLITLIIQLGIQPAMNALKAHALPLDVMQSVDAGRFKMLHGISSMAYLIKSRRA
jgi:cation transport ATPase